MKRIMLKIFFTIVFIGYFFGIHNLRSANYNVITVSRDTTSDYNNWQ